MVLTIFFCSQGTEKYAEKYFILLAVLHTSLQEKSKSIVILGLSMNALFLFGMQRNHQKETTVKLIKFEISLST